MDGPTIFAIIILLSILSAVIAVPIWIVRRILRWRRGGDQAGLTSSRRPLTYAEQIEEAKSALITDNRASLPILSPSIIDYRPVGGERVFAIQQEVKRLEIKSTGRYQSGGLSLSIPIVKGVRYRVGGGTTRSEKTLQVTASGRLIITDKALAFESSEKNERISWNQISDVEILRDGFQIAKRTGPPRIYSVARPDPQFSAILELMLAKTE